MFYILADGLVSMDVISDVVCINLAGSASILGDFLEVTIQVSDTKRRVSAYIG